MTKEISDKQLNGHKVAKEEAVDRSFLGKLFRRQKNFRFRKQDDVEGPLYIDPHLIDKMEKPNKCNLNRKFSILQRLISLFQLKCIASTTQTYTKANSGCGIDCK